MPNRAPLAYVLVSLIAGLLLARINSEAILMPALTGLAGSALAVFLARGQGRAVRLWGLVFLFSGSAIFWSYGALRLPPAPNLSALDEPPREQTVVIEIVRIFKNKETGHGRISGLGKVLSGPDYRRLKPGARIYLNLKTSSQVARTILQGVQLESAGVVRTINPSDESGFNSYLRNCGVHYRLSQNRSLSVLNEASAFRIFCARQQERFLKILQAGSIGAEEPARVYAAMLLGHRVGLSEGQIARYQASGAMHLFAISGLHIGVIAAALAQFLKIIRIPTRIAPFLGLPLLFLYVEITGGTPSATRAFLMTLFFWASFAFKRQRNPFAALMASAVGVLLVDPLQLWSLGFQLSYAVVGSILLLGLPLQSALVAKFQLYRWLPESDWSLWQRFVDRTIEALLLLFAVSFSAWVASIPLSLVHFGYFSLIAVFINMLLVNMAALVICTGCLSLAGGLVLPIGFSAFFNHAAWLVISLMDSLTRLVVTLPGVVLKNQDFPLLYGNGVLVFYFLWLVILGRKPTVPRLYQIALPPAALLLAITLGVIWT